MPITLTEVFLKDTNKLDPSERDQLFSVILKLPQVFGQPHIHGGLGLRKLHHSGIYETRLGLGLRLVFGFEQNNLYLHRIGNHDDIQRYLKSL